MKYLIALLIFIPVYIYGQKIYVDSKSQPQLWGSVSLEDLKEEPYASWFNKYQKDYEPSLDKINTGFLSDVKVKVFMGTWCGDTKRWLPPFTKLWTALGLSEEQLEITAIHNEGEHYKNAPDMSDTLWDIHRVPTFIFLKNNQEVGRIVERPLNSLEQDIAQIAAGLSSIPRYRAVSFIQNYIEENGLDTAYIKTKPLARYLRRINSGSSELNSYGYVLSGDGKPELAEFIFLLNRTSYPYEPNVHDSLGEFYFKQEKYDLAKESFTEVLRLKGYDKNAINYLSKIEKSLSDVGK